MTNSTTSLFPTRSMQQLENMPGLTPAQVKRIKNMRRGEENNSKGQVYETHFAVFRLLQLTAMLLTNVQEQDVLAALLKSGEFDKIHLSNHVLGAVNDLTIQKYDNNGLHKSNYQLKDSPNKGKLNQDFIELFNIQTIIDQNQYHAQTCVHIIVCSDKETVDKNMSNSGINHPKGTMTIFFPSFSSMNARILEQEEFRNLLACVCSDASNYDAAARMIAVPFSQGDFAKTLRELWDDILSNTNPKIFARYTSVQLQPFFVDQCQKIGFSVSHNHITYAGFSVAIPDDLHMKLKDRDIATLDTPEKIFQVLGYDITQGAFDV
jgi:hypothetical protein